MQVQIRSRGIPLSDEARARIERHVRLGLGRHGGDRGPISRVRVAVADAKDAQGFVEHGSVRCSVLVAMGVFAVIEIDERDPDLDVAVRRAVARASRAMERRLS